MRFNELFKHLNNFKVKITSDGNMRQKILTHSQEKNRESPKKCTFFCVIENDIIRKYRHNYQMHRYTQVK